MGAPIAYKMRSLDLKNIHINSQSHNEDTIKSLSPLLPLPQSQSPSSAASPAAWESFQSSMDPEHGLLTRYLELGQVAALIGDVLFVHGAITERNMG